jgi:hypothetical protein
MPGTWLYASASGEMGRPCSGYRECWPKFSFQRHALDDFEEIKGTPSVALRISQIIQHIVIET